MPQFLLGCAVPSALSAVESRSWRRGRLSRSPAVPVLTSLLCPFSYPFDAVCNRPPALNCVEFLRRVQLVPSANLGPSKLSSSYLISRRSISKTYNFVRDARLTRASTRSINKSVRPPRPTRGPQPPVNLSYPRSAHTTSGSPSLSSALILPTRRVSLERLPQRTLGSDKEVKTLPMPQRCPIRRYGHCFPGHQQRRIDDELACEARDRTVGWF